MVTSHQIIKGAARWIDTELLPTLNGFPRYGVGVAAALISKQGEVLLDKALRSDKAQAMGIVRDGAFDYDLLRTALVAPFPDEGLRLDADQINDFIGKFLGKLGPILNFKVQGGITFRREDVERLFDLIREA